MRKANEVLRLKGAVLSVREIPPDLPTELP
jgi:hypothetical protein